MKNIGDNIKKFREFWPRKLIVKSILSAEQARAAVDAGADGIVIGRRPTGAHRRLLRLPCLSSATFSLSAAGSTQARRGRLACRTALARVGLQARHGNSGGRGIGFLRKSDFGGLADIRAAGVEPCC